MPSMRGRCRTVPLSSDLSSTLILYNTTSVWSPTKTSSRVLSSASSPPMPLASKIQIEMSTAAGSRHKTSPRSRDFSKTCSDSSSHTPTPTGQSSTSRLSPRRLRRRSGMTRRLTRIGISLPICSWKCLALLSLSLSSLSSKWNPILTESCFPRLFNYAYTDPSLEDPINAFATNARSESGATSGFDGLQIYVSYGHGDEGPVPLYGERKLPRLRALKQKWDPDKRFNFNEPF